MKDIELFNGNCLEAMETLADNSVDMVLCDPPYGTTDNKWDTVIPFDEMWFHLNRICKENAAILLFGQQPFTAQMIMSNVDNFRYDIIWKKNRPVGFMNARKMPMRIYENVSVFYRKLPTYNPVMNMENYGGQRKLKQFTKGEKRSENYNTCAEKAYFDEPMGTYPTDYVEFDIPTNADRQHPTQKPVNLLEYFISTYSNRGDTVLDFTMGSGSTGVAADNKGRNFIGMEMEKKYFNVAKARMGV